MVTCVVGLLSARGARPSLLKYLAWTTPNRESMMRAPLELAVQRQQQQQQATEDEGALQSIREEAKEDANDAGLRVIRHVAYLRQHRDTFLAYQWMLLALARRGPGAAGGCQVRVADVVMFSEGEPTTWIFSNKLGCVDSRKFDGAGSENMWPRFLKTARRAAGVRKDDL